MRGINSSMVNKLLLLVVSVIPLLAEGQSFYAIRRPRNLTVYGGTGTALYKGELVNPKTLGKVRYNLVFGAEYHFSGRVSVRAEATWFRITGSDKDANDDRVERNLSFFSNNQELSVHGVVYFLKEPKQFYQRSAFNIYAFAGVGLLHMNPKAEYDGKKYALQPLQTEGVKYSRFQTVIPFGVGVKFMIDPLHNLIIEGGYRTTFTDYLDDVSSRRYTDPQLLDGGVGGLSATLSDRRKERDPAYPLNYTKGVRGNPKQNDGYFLMNVKLQYYLPVAIGRDAEANRFYKKKRKLFNRKK